MRPPAQRAPPRAQWCRCSRRRSRCVRAPQRSPRISADDPAFKSLPMSQLVRNAISAANAEECDPAIERVIPPLSLSDLLAVDVRNESGSVDANAVLDIFADWKGCATGGTCDGKGADGQRSSETKNARHADRNQQCRHVVRRCQRPIRWTTCCEDVSVLKTTFEISSVDR